MAIRLRKLLHYLNSTSNVTITTPCTDFCDPTCVGFDECYTFPPEPDSFPPPLPPTTTIVATPSTTTRDPFHLSPLLIVIIIILAGAFLLISYYAVVIKYCSFWTRLLSRRDNPRQMQQLNHQLDNPQGPESRNDVSNRFNPVVDHPIWLISTVGLHQSIINSITKIQYKKDDGLIDGTDCSVCLSEFQEGEILRLLPKCKHAFHIECIDTWLRSHTNCPMCRASIVANSDRPSMGSNDPSFGNSRRAEFYPMDNDSDTSDVELGIIQNVNINNNDDDSNNVSLVGENRGEAGEFEVEIEIDQIKVENDITPIALLVRRSYSMDYRNVSGTTYMDQNSNSNPNSSSAALVGSSSSRPVPPRVRVMKRSYSWSERVFWSSRNLNCRYSNILP